MYFHLPKRVRGHIADQKHSPWLPKVHGRWKAFDSSAVPGSLFLRIWYLVWMCTLWVVREGGLDGWCGVVGGGVFEDMKYCGLY